MSVLSIQYPACSRFLLLEASAANKGVADVV